MENNKYKSKKFLLPILSLVLISIISIASISSYITINMYKNHVKEHIKKTKDDYTKKHKDKVYKEVMFVHDSIEFQSSQIETKLKASLKEKTKIALEIANSIYNKYKNTHNKEEIKKKIAEALAVIKYNNNRGYYFMYDNKTKIMFGHPLKSFQNKDMSNFRDSKGRNLMQTDEKILEKKKIGFNKIYFNRPDIKNQYPKITCIGKFEALDLVFGIEEYLDVVEKRTKEHVLKRFSQNSFNQGDKYLVILDIHNLNGGDDFATVLLNSNRPELVGKKVSDKTKDIKGNRFRKNFLDLIKEKGEGFSEYWYKKPSTELPALKVSFIYYQKNWKWLILSGFYYEDLENKIETMEKSIVTHTNNIIYKTITWVILLSIIAIMIAIYVSFRIDKTIKSYTNTIIEYEDNKRKQEHLLIQQSKMAAMGEMLANIAHQWRQPLSAISTAATGARIQKELNCLSDEQLYTTFDNINNSTQYLSQTIDDFRVFFSSSKNKSTKFKIKNTIDKTLNLLTAQFVAQDINIIVNIDDIEVTSIENELIQVLINILNNARDSVIKKENQKKLIFINCIKSNNDLEIEIKDNGDGIPEKILDRVFEPYFTTKYKSQGTGIGLFISNEIVIRRLRGTLSVSNENFNYEGIDYNGAKFIIKIPI